MNRAIYIFAAVLLSCVGGTLLIWYVGINVDSIWAAMWRGSLLALAIWGTLGVFYLMMRDFDKRYGK